MGLSRKINGRYSSIITLNGSGTPKYIYACGYAEPMRLINITANGVALWVLMQGVPFEQANWKPLGERCGNVADTQAQPRPARQLIAVGETYDFELVPRSSPPAPPFWLELRRSDGGYLLQAPSEHGNNHLTGVRWLNPTPAQHWEGNTAAISRRRMDVAVLMITAYGGADTRAKALRAGAAGIFTKPIDFQLLRGEIAERLNTFQTSVSA